MLNYFNFFFKRALEKNITGVHIEANNGTNVVKKSQCKLF